MMEWTLVIQIALLMAWAALLVIAVIDSARGK